MFLDRIFKKTVSKDVVNPNIFIDILDYDDLDDYSKALVDKYKEEYMTLFKTISSTSELDKDLIDEIKMYQELVLNVLFKDTFGDLLESKVASIKLNIYSKKYEEINRILKLKYVALQEIKKDKKYLSIHNRLYLRAKYKININQTISYYENTLYNLIATVNDKIFKCVSTSLLNNPKIDLYKEELIKRYNEVNSDYKQIFNREIPILDNISESIAYAEIELEKYVLLNKSKLNDYRNRLLEISNNDIKDINERDNIINELMNIKNIYIIFNKYGRNIVKQEEFEDLYLVIFNVYTYFPYDYGFRGYFINCRYSCENDEIEYYRKIIKYKYDLLKCGKSVVFTNNREYDFDVINTLINIFEWYKRMNYKDDNYNFSLIDNIIGQHLALLLSLDYEDGLNMYLEYKVGKDNFASCFEKLKYISVVKQYNNDIDLINNPYFKRYSKVYIYTKKYEEELEIFRSIYKNSINKNQLPVMNKDYFCESSWKEYIIACDKGPLYIPSNIKNVEFDYHDKVLNRIYVLPEYIESLYLITFNIFDPEKMLIFPAHISNSFNIKWFFPSVNPKIEINDLAMWIDTIFKTFVFSEEIFYLDNYKLIDYFNRIFSFLKEPLSSLQNDSNFSVESFFPVILKTIMDNFSYFTFEGKIVKVFEGKKLKALFYDAYSDGIIDFEGRLYESFIESLAMPIMEFKNNYYHKNKLLTK